MNTFLHYLQMRLQNSVRAFHKHKPQLIVFILLFAMVLPFQNCGGKFKSVPVDEIQMGSATQNGDNPQPTPPPVPAAFFRLSEATVAQGEPAIFDLILDNPLKEDVVFELKVTDGSAHAGEHYISLIQHLAPNETFVVPETGGAGNPNLFKMKRGSAKASFQVMTLRKVPATTELEFSVSAEVTYKENKFVKEASGRVKLALYKPLQMQNISSIPDGNFTCLQNLDGSVDCKGVLVTDRNVVQNNVNYAAFTRVPQFQGAKLFAAGPHSACVITAANALACIGDLPEKTFPQVKSLVIGYSYICAVDMNGVVICDGPGGSTVFGPGLGFMEPVSYLVGGYDHICAETVSKKHFCWGFSLNGQVGTGAIDENGTTYFSATQVTGSAALAFQKIYGGGVSNCGSTADKKFYCWGHVFAKDNENSAAPLEMGITDVKDVAISYNKICALHESDKWTCFYGDGLKDTGNVANGSVAVDYTNKASLLIGDQLVVKVTGNKWHCPESEVAIDLLGAQCWP